MRLSSTLLSPSSKNKKRKENSTHKKFLIFRKWNFLPPGLKNSLYFLKWKFLASYFSYILGENFPNSRNEKISTKRSSYIFLYFRKTTLCGFNIKKLLLFSQKKAFLIFWVTKISYISEKGNAKKLLIFQEVTFQVQEIKKPTLKKFLIFWKTELSGHKENTLRFFITIFSCVFIFSCVVISNSPQKLLMSYSSKKQYICFD